MMVRNHAQMRDSNVDMVFRTILEEGPISRTHISERSSLSPSTVSVITAELQAKDLIRECGRDGAHVGRPSVLLEINPRGGYFISADLTSQHLSIAVVDLSLKPLQNVPYKEPMQQGEALYHQLVTTLRQTQVACERQNRPVIGIGVATPGLVTQSGFVIEADNLGWEGIELRTRLQHDLGTDVVVQNDTNAAASGEFQYGVYRSLSVQNMILVSVDTGIGCGVILDSKLFAGTGGLAGEIGHVQVDPAGPKCACGRHGCLEAMAAAPAMLRDYRLRTGVDDVTDIVRFLELATSGDDMALAVLRTAAKRIGRVIGSQINFLNVDTVLLAGRVSQSSDTFLQTVKEAAMEVALPSFHEGLSFNRSSLAANAAPIGIASLCMIQMFRRAE